MAEYIKRTDVEEWLKDICEATESDADYVLARVDEIPSADVAEVKHGKWIKPTSDPYTMLAKCSVCGFDLGFITNFCPNCGARMDGE